MLLVAAAIAATLEMLLLAVELTILIPRLLLLVFLRKNPKCGIGPITKRHAPPPLLGLAAVVLEESESPTHLVDEVDNRATAVDPTDFVKEGMMNGVGLGTTGDKETELEIGECNETDCEEVAESDEEVDDVEQDGTDVFVKGLGEVKDDDEVTDLQVGEGE